MARFWLRLEGLVLLIVSVMVYHNINGTLWWLLPGFLAVDLSMVGYLINNRIGAWAYNLAHALVLPVLLLGFGFLYEIRWALLASLIWIFHIGVDRLCGYGLKEGAGFRHTHLGFIGEKS